PKTFLGWRLAAAKSLIVKSLQLLSHEHWDHEPERDSMANGRIANCKCGGLGQPRPTLPFMESRGPPSHADCDHGPAAASRAQTASWSAPVPWRFSRAGRPIESARGLAHSKTWRRIGGSWRDHCHPGRYAPRRIAAVPKFTTARLLPSRNVDDSCAFSKFFSRKDSFLNRRNALVFCEEICVRIVDV